MYILPTIRINEGQYRGKLSYTEVLRALCAGFNKNDEPAACNKVGEADCRVGAPGDSDCSARCPPPPPPRLPGVHPCPVLLHRAVPAARSVQGCPRCLEWASLDPETTWLV